MSRTRKTRPLHVRMADPKDHGVEYIEVHNHINGRECDLPVSHDAKSIANSYDGPFVDAVTRPCHYSWEYKGKNLCGCRMCTGHDFRKQDIRKSRHEAKQELHQVLKTHVYEDEELADEFGDREVS